MNQQQRLVISGWNCISPYGIGAEALCRGLADGTVPESEVRLILAEDESAPTTTARIAADFDINTELGKKGTRTLDRLTGLSIATVGMVLRADTIGAAADRARIGVVLGSSQGSLCSISGFTRETLRYERPDYVNPALFPNTVMNCAAGQTAIWHGCRGPNVTVSAGQLSAIAALRFSMIALRQGYADLVLAGAAEEFTSPNAWAHFVTHDATVRAYAPLAEGCAMFAIESAPMSEAKGRKALVEILSADLATYESEAGDAAKADALAACIGRILERHDVAPGQIAWICKSAVDPTLSGVEDAALSRALSGAVKSERVIGINEAVGNAVSASAAFQLAVLLARFSDGPQVGRSYGLLVAIDEAGSLGAVLIRNEV